ncbi:MAG TPA: hypothetical protein VGD29_22820 [Actinoplanes sp.]
MSESVGRLRSLLLSVPAAIRHDFLATVAVQWIWLAVGLILFHLVARRGGVDGFAYYQIARSAVATVQPLTMAGLGTGLQRYLPRCGARAPTLARRALGVQIAIIAVVAVAVSLVSGPLAGLLGIDGNQAVGAIIVMLAGNCLCSTAVAALRGAGQPGFANATLLAGLAVVPVVAFFLASGIESFLVLQGVGMLAAAGCAILVIERTPASATASEDTASLRRLVRYGLGRTPGDLALPALFAFPTFAVAHALPLAGEAGYVGFATSAVTLICSIFGLLTPVLLPRLSRLVDSPGGGASLHRSLLALPLVAAGVAAVIGGLLEILAPVLVREFLGAEFGGAAGILRLSLLSAIPLAVFYAVRPTLDALQEVPVTTALLVGALVVQVSLTYALNPLLPPAAAAVLAMLVASALLGAASYVALTRAMASRRA